LKDKIVTLYQNVLEFLVEAYHYYNQSTGSRIARSIFTVDASTVKYIAQVRALSNEVDAYMTLVSDEAVFDIEKKVGEIDDGLQREKNDLKQLLDRLSAPVNRMATQISSIDDYLSEEGRMKIFEWLSSVRYVSHHRAKLKVLLPGSGQWLLKKQEFLKWFDSSSSSILWLHGIPGSGKSMLVARVIEVLKERGLTETSPAPIAYFYCARSATEPERSDPTEVLRSLLEQLSCSDLDLPIRQPVVRAYTEKKKDARGRRPEKLELEETVELILELAESNPATIILDGLDECDPSRRQDLLDGLQTILRRADNVIKIFVSSRDDHDLVHRLSKTPNTYIRATDSSDDIDRFVRSRVDEAIKSERIICGAVSLDLKRTIISTLINKATGMFRLASLHIDRLCDPRLVKTEANVLSALSNLPQDLKNSYDMVLSQIQNSEEPNPMFAHRIMKLLMCCQQALDSHAFIFAVCADLCDRPPLEPSDVLRICCNLVTHDDELDTYRFAHLSVQEYLKGLDGYSWSEVNALVAELCLSWLLARDAMLHETRLWSGHISLDRFHAGRSSFDTHVDIFWPKYASEAAELRETSRLNLLFRKFILSSKFPEETDSYGQWSSRLKAISNYSTPLYRLCAQCWSFPPNPLFTACAFNFSELIPDLLTDLAAFLAQNSGGHNCAQIAIWCHSKEALQAIFDSRQRLKIEDKYWHNLLYLASELRSEPPLKTALNVFGPGFVTEDIFNELVNSLFRGHPHLAFLPLVMENNKELRITEDTIRIALEHSYYDAFATKELLKYAHDIEITVSLINSALQIGERCFSSMAAILTARNAATPPPKDEAFPSDVVFSTVADNADELSSMLIIQGPGTLELTWKDVTIAKKLRLGRESIACLLRTRPKITQAAINMLISLWDPDMVRKLLVVQRVEITPDVIRAAAGNLEFGNRIMNLLLEKEMEDFE
jgi:hypothetical protein